SLRTLAENTDGRAIVNRNDLANGMKQIIRDSSAYYLLGYSSTAAPADGKFHEIKVRVKRPGLQVRARKGYWALTAEETSRAPAPPNPAPAAGGDAGAPKRRVRHDARTSHSNLGRNVARRQRQDARDVRLGADAANGSRPAARARRGAVTGVGHGRRPERVADLPRPGA